MTKEGGRLFLFWCDGTFSFGDEDTHSIKEIRTKSTPMVLINDSVNASSYK